MTKQAELYERDFLAWTQEQAALLKANRLMEIDAANLIEELEDMGRSQRNQLISWLGVLLAHLLKWSLQPELRGNSWKYPIKEQRRRIRRLLDENPSLKNQIDPAFQVAYGDAILMAARETGLDEDRFPADCSFTLAQALDDAYWPD